MQTVGRVESLWRYPVKSMRGEELEQAYLGYPGMYGDRLYAFHSSAAPKDFPYFTGREQENMLLYCPVFRNREHMNGPSNLEEAEAMAPGLTPVYAQDGAFMVDVQTPLGGTLAINDPRLIDSLREGIRDRHELTLLRSDQAMTDCRPISLFSIQSVRQLAEELGADLDKRRFRANIYVDLGPGSAFSENEFVGHVLQIGNKVVVAITDRDPRCKMITLDPDTAQPNPGIMRHLARTHDGKAGIYGAVLVDGMVRSGDQIQLT